jgi:hypothetical protein
MNTYSRRASPRSSSCGVVLVSTVLTSWSCNKLYIKTRCNKHWLYYLFHYLSFYVWNVILADIKVMHSVLALKLVWQAGCWNDKISCWCHTVAKIMSYLYIWISESRPRSLGNLLLSISHPSHPISVSRGWLNFTFSFQPVVEINSSYLLVVWFHKTNNQMVLWYAKTKDPELVQVQASSGSHLHLTSDHYMRNTQSRHAHTKNGETQIALLRHHILHYKVIRDTCSDASPIRIHLRRMSPIRGCIWDAL